jgi:hypothetical protein
LPSKCKCTAAVGRLQRFIGELERCIDELEAFDPPKVNPYIGPEVPRLEAMIDEALAAAFGTVSKSSCRAQHQRPILYGQRQSALNNARQRISRPNRCPIKSP